MDRTYKAASQRYHWTDNEVMRKRWKVFQEHQKRCRQKASKLHGLYKSNRTAWEHEISKLPAAEQKRQRRLEESKTRLLSRLR